VDTTTPRTSAYLLVAGVALSTLGFLLVELSPTDPSAPGTPASVWAGALLAAVGFAAVVTGLVRWALRTRRTAAALERTPSPAGV
jgi:uncharacterized membrane protein YidH (DUF202 family)